VAKNARDQLLPKVIEKSFLRTKSVVNALYLYSLAATRPHRKL